MNMELQTWSPERISLIQRTIAPTVTKDEFDMFIERCKQTGLDPIARQIYAISRYDKQVGGNKMSIQVSIDGMRLLAERSGKYAGQVGPLWCDENMQWKEVWLSSKPPLAAKVGVIRSDFKEPLFAVAKYSSYVQTGKDNQVYGLWAKMPDLMLAKCAESLALRRAFPAETSGFYTREEMGQAENEVIVEAEVHEVPSAEKPKAYPGTEHLTNGDGSPAFKAKMPQAPTMTEIWDAFVKLYKPERWETFKQMVLGQKTTNEALTEDDRVKLWDKLVAIKKAAVTSGKE